VLKFFPDVVDQTQAAVLALSLFIDWVNRMPSSRPEFREPEDVRDEDELYYPLEWIFHDLRFSPGVPRLDGLDSGATVTEYLDLRLNKILDGLRVTRQPWPHGLPGTLGEADETGYVAPGQSLSAPMASDLAALGIDSLIHAIDSIPVGEHAAREVLEWNKMAVETLAWSWQFLNVPYGGSRGQNAITVFDWSRLHVMLADSTILYFAIHDDVVDWFEEVEGESERVDALMSIWEGPGWYETSVNEFIGPNLPLYLALEEFVGNRFYYRQFHKRWVELVGCRWPIARW
ncbi:hypothetical protein LCGC14_2927300, partial [marine sediment metagenome]